MESPTHSNHAIALLQLSFKATRRIANLPFYHGQLWSALFRDLIRDYAGIALPLADMGFAVHPIETGRVAFSKGDTINLGLSFPFSYFEAIFTMLKSFNAIPIVEGKLTPATLVLERITCRVSGEEYTVPPGGHPPSPWQGNGEKTDSHRGKDDDPPDQLAVIPYNQAHVEVDALQLMAFNTFQIVFHAPLRLKSPSLYKKRTNNTFIGWDAFQLEPRDTLNKLWEFLTISHSPSGIHVTDNTLVWLDCPTHDKTLGGVMGHLTLKGRLSKEAAEKIVRHQYVGIAKNRVYGFGFYHIPQLEKYTVVRPFTRGISLFDKAFSIHSLTGALNRLPNASPGPDGLTPADLKKAGPVFIENLSAALHDHRDIPGPILHYRKAKKSGGYRIIHQFNAKDKVIHRAIADALLTASETFFSNSSFAFRRGLNRKGAAEALTKAFDDGYQYGFKADIKAFFESIDTDSLCHLLSALFPFDPLPDTIGKLIDHTFSQGVTGLPQGSPLSPVLSNLYLDRFDREMGAANFKLIRYSDDFVVLHKSKTTKAFCLEAVEGALQKLGLALNPSKTMKIDTKRPFKFLGYEIVASSFKIDDQHKGVTEKEHWLPVFREEWQRGYPVYLTTLCRGAYSSGPHLVINYEEPQKAEEIPWNRISRIIVVGRSSFSGGIVYRAVKEDIPVTLIDIYGKVSGYVLSAVKPPVSSIEAQKAMVENPDFCLEFAREIIAAQIHNRHVILRRNNIREERLKTMASKALQAETVEQLRGYEGSAAHLFFQKLKELVNAHGFEFDKRVYRPPDNPVNAMLSFGYTLLYNRIATALRDKGLDPYHGFYHRKHGLHCALASDLIEELRHVIERVMLALIRLKEVKPDDFKISIRDGTPTCKVEDDAFRKFIRRYERVMGTTFKYTEHEKISYNAYIDEMIDKLIRAIKLKVPYTSLRIK